MTSLPIHSASRPQNPVLQNELNHQRYVIQKSRSGRLWILLAAMMVVPALIMAIYYIVVVLFGLIDPPPLNEYPTTFHGNAGVLLLIINMSLYPVVNLVTLGLSSNSIHRERQGQTWSLLRMTTIDSDLIVMGKWRASLHAMNGDHGMVLILRVGLLAHILAVTVPSRLMIDGLTIPDQTYFLWLVVPIILQSLLDSAMTASLGIIGAIPEEGSGAISTSYVVIFRLIYAVLVGWWFFEIAWNVGYAFPYVLVLAWMGVFVTMAFLAGSLGFAGALLRRVG